MGALRHGERGRSDERADSRPPPLGGHARRVGGLWTWLSPLAPRPRPRGRDAHGGSCAVRELVDFRGRRAADPVRARLRRNGARRLSPARALGGTGPGPLGVFMADGASLRAGACGQPGDGHCKGGRGARRPRAVTGPDVPPRCRRRDRRRDRLPDLARQGYDRTGRRRRPADPVRRAFRRASALRRRRRPRERRDGASARLEAAGVGRALRRGLGASDRGDPDDRRRRPSRHLVAVDRNVRSSNG